MSLSLKISKNLRAQGQRLGRCGLSERAHTLVMEYATKYPDGHWREAIKLAGRLRAISLAARGDSYWREKTDSGFNDEAEWDLPKFQPKEVEA
jgi:hypothetical protein